MKKFHIFSVCCGIALLVFLIWKIGIRELWQEISLLGWGLVPIILIEGIADLFHALGWRHCLSGPHRSLPFLRIFRIRMAGYAINYLTPTAALGGEVTKGALLSLNQKGAEAITGVLIGKLSFAISQLLFVAAGSILIVTQVDLPVALWVGMLISSGLLALGIFGFLLVQKYGKLGCLIRWLVSHNLGGKFLQKLSHEINEVDEALKVFYRTNPLGLLWSVFWHLVAFTVGIVQTWLFIELLSNNATIPVAAGIWILGNWFDLLTFAVPLDIGVQEGTRVLAFKALGFDLLMGMTYGVTLRLQQIFWAGFGLLNYALLLSEKKKLEGSLPIEGQSSALAFIRYRRGRG
ncbi:MAG: lysylphosphatidylglycerol synthase domain-containing protein [Desulforhabdus sp.]|jgi:uncharacterized protein (TIRG00374 family)|nr:lysylphosphatidylglycerol synthase domain-containing protein [Desulforhabdus sp.]